MRGTRVMGRRGLLLLLVLPLALLTGACREEARPSGVAERWIEAVNDQGRPGLRGDAADRAAEHGDPAAAEKLIPPDPKPDATYFTDFEVGKDTVDGTTARVPVRASVRENGHGLDEVVATVVLDRSTGHWRVVDVVERAPGEAVPSEGGERPARATFNHWLTAFALGLFITVVSVLVIEAQPIPTAAQT